MLWTSLITTPSRSRVSLKARAAFTVNSASVFKEDVDMAHTIVDDTLSYIPWGGEREKSQIHSMQIIIISYLWISVVGIYPCRYHSTANRKMNRLHRCRHAVSGFLRLQSEVLWREDYAVIHRPAPTAQTAH